MATVGSKGKIYQSVFFLILHRRISDKK